VKKPASLVYGVADTPPLHLVVMSGVQHVALISIDLVFPLLIFRAAHEPLQAVTSLLAVGMIVLGVGSLLQSARAGPVGSGYMCPSSFTASYFAPSLLAVKFGGLPLVFGMTVFAGLLEAALAPLLHRLRAILPSEICGLVIFMIGLSAGIAGLRTLVGAQDTPVIAREWWVAGFTLATMVALNVWGRGMARMLCALAGLVAGYVAAVAAGLIGSKEMAAIAAAPWIGVPDVRAPAWSFDLMLAVPFAIACIAAAMKAMGTITLCQRTNDAEWVRPDMRSITRGVLADGASTAIAGIAGTVGTNTCTSSVGLAAATGVAARRVAWAAGAMLIVLGFLPKLPAALAVMPRSVVVAALMFAVSFILINGLQVMSSRMLDARRTLVIGLSIVGGTAVEVFPIISGAASGAMAPIVGSALVFSTSIALALNLLFRLGVRRTITIDLDPAGWKPSDVEDVLIRQGGAWGARAEVINRASWAICQVLEAVAENCWRTGTLVVEVSFDEFSLDVMISYYGKLLEFPTQRPDEDEILSGDDGVRRLAGYMLRHAADRMRSELRYGRPVLMFHFDH
jgi:NCS2 family nucleobase:cation symporter-2